MTPAGKAMRHGLVNSSLIGLLLAGCSGTPGASITLTQLPGASSTAKQSATPAAPGGVAATALALPDHIGLTLPSAIAPSAQIISQDGNGIVAQGGGNIVAQGGGNIVAQGGGNYHLLAAGTLFDTPPTAQQAADAGATVAVTNVLLFAFMAAQADRLLQDANKLYNAHLLAPGLDATLDYTWGGVLRAHLVEAPGHNVLTLYRGATLTPASELLAVTFANKLQGTAVVRTPAQATSTDGTAMYVVFDLQAGTVSADVISDQRNAKLGMHRVRWEFTQIANAAAGATAFKLRCSSYVTGSPAELEGLTEISINFAQDGGGAGFAAVRPAADVSKLGTRVEYVPSDGSLPTSSSTVPEHDYYFSSTYGVGLTPENAGAYKALLPGDNDLEEPFVTDPSVGDMLNAAPFLFAS